MQPIRHLHHGGGVDDDSVDDAGDDHDDAVDDDDGPIVRISSIELQLALIVELALSTTR